MTFPLGMIGNYQITYIVTGSNTTLTTQLAATTTGFSALNMWNAGGTDLVVVPAAATLAQPIASYMLTAAFNGSSTAATNWTLTAGTLPANITGADLWVQQVNQNLVT